MKSADIKVGEQYVVGYGACGLVLETRVERCGRKDGVRVKFMSGYRSGHEAVVASRSVDELWSEYEAKRQARDLQQKIAKQDRERVEKAVGHLRRARESVGVEVMNARTSYGYSNGGREHHGSVLLSEEAIKTLTDLVASEQVSERAETVAAQADADPLAELLV